MSSQLTPPLPLRQLLDPAQSSSLFTCVVAVSLDLTYQSTEREAA